MQDTNGNQNEVYDINQHYCKKTSVLWLKHSITINSIECQDPDAIN